MNQIKFAGLVSISAQVTAHPGQVSVYAMNQWINPLALPIEVPIVPLARCRI